VIGIAGDVDLATAERLAGEPARLPRTPAPSAAALVAPPPRREPRLVWSTRPIAPRPSSASATSGRVRRADDTAALLALETGFGGMFSRG
jgi:hypothetical protein